MVLWVGIIKMPIYSPLCIDETKGFDILFDGSQRPHKLGRMVLTIKECRDLLDKRVKYEPERRE